MYYTKYRPQKFSEISKPNDVASALSTQINTKKTVHAYLFVGPRGTGKTTTARVLAKALNCKKIDQNGDPCTKCDSCKAITNQNFLDLIEIDAASNRGIDDIRNLKEKIKLAPSVGERKIYIIDEVHMLTTEAFNALLKTLEEPPAHVTLILCTTEIHKVPETIKSRCQLFNFKRATISQLTRKLEEISKQEKVSVKKQELEMIASAAHGGFRDAETLLQQVVEGDINIESLLSIGSKVSYVEFVDYLIEKNVKGALNKVNGLHENGFDLYVWVGELLKYLRDLLFINADAHENIVEVSDELFSKMSEQARKLGNGFIAEIIDSLMKAQNKIKSSFITQLPIEISVVEICSDENEINSKKKELKLPNKPIKGIDHDESKESNEDLEVERKEDDVKVQGEEEFEENVEGVIEVDYVKKNWNTIIKEVSLNNNGISALLKMASVSEIVGRKIIVEVPYDFHKERLESSKNREMVEEVFGNVFEKELFLTCKVCEKKRRKKTGETGKLTDYNVMVPTNVTSPENIENILDVLDGGLPLS